MKSKYFVCLLFISVISSCTGYIKFEIGRYMFVFFSSLVIGIIALIVTGNKKGKNK